MSKHVNGHKPEEALMDKTKTDGTARTVIGTAEVWFEADEKRIFIRPFKGCVLEVDLRRYAFKSAHAAAEFIMKLADRSAYDTLILANLIPVKREDRGQA